MPGSVGGAFDCEIQTPGDCLTNGGVDVGPGLDDLLLDRRGRGAADRGIGQIRLGRLHRGARDVDLLVRGAHGRRLGVGLRLRLLRGALGLGDDLDARALDEGAAGLDRLDLRHLLMMAPPRGDGAERDDQPAKKAWMRCIDFTNTSTSAGVL